MFRFTKKPSSGSHSQYLAKITHLVQSGYIELVQDFVSVMAAYYDLRGHTRLCQCYGCILWPARCVRTCEAAQDFVSVMAAYCDLRGMCTHASQVTICSYNTDVLYELYVSTLNQVCSFS